MNKLIEGVKNQIKRQEYEIEAIKQRDETLEKYLNKIEFEAVVKEKLKESELF